MARSTCAACGERFYSTASFDKHRIGSHERGQRRCMDEREMKARGLTLRPDGCWTMKAPGDFLWAVRDRDK
jgi:hypothetical protein